MRKIKSITKLKSLLKVGDWLLVIDEGKKRKWVFEILKINNNFEVITIDYKMFGEWIEKGQEQTNLKDWVFVGWDWYKLTEKEIGKWRKINLLKAL